MTEGSGLERALPRSAYVDPGVWETERERLFAHQWFGVGRQEDVPDSGDLLAVDVAGESILLVRDGDDLRGFYNLCRHRGSTLVDPGCSGHVAGGLRCPYHAWTYGLDGGLRRAPFVDVADRYQFALHKVAVDTWGGWVFVHLTPTEAAPLIEQLGPTPPRVANYPLSDLRRSVTLTYEVAANWKVIAENFNECYHCGPVHPELCDLVPSFRGGRGLDWEDGIPHREGAWTFTESGMSDREPFPGLSEAERVRHKGELVYPNLLLSLSADHVAALFLTPLGAGHTRVTGEFLFSQDELARPDHDPSDVTDFWDRINRQDWQACERVQRGMASRAHTHGWFAPMEDESADIRRWYSPLMGEDG